MGLLTWHEGWDKQSMMGNPHTKPLTGYLSLLLMLSSWSQAAWNIVQRLHAYVLAQEMSLTFSSGNCLTEEKLAITTNFAIHYIRRTNAQSSTNICIAHPMSVHITLRGRFLHDFAGRIFDLHNIMNSCLILYKSLHKFHGITIDERLWIWYKTLI